MSVSHTSCEKINNNNNNNNNEGLITARRAAT